MKWLLFATALLPFSISPRLGAFEYQSYYHPQWLKVLHYEKKLWGNYESRADGKDFFFSSQGATDPKSEFDASYKAFKKNKDNSLCRFPARSQIMEKILGEKFAARSCTEFNQWKERLKINGISLVFASSYPNNPSSTFGHTLLKLHSKASADIQGKNIAKSDPNDLLNYFVSYVAMTTDKVGLLYAIKGIFGGYKGQVQMGPYFLKVNEYNQGESRDLWEYRLPFDQQEIDLLLAHIWEVAQNTYFDYYFTYENCAMVLLAFMQVAKPDWDLLKDFAVYVIPSDTVKAVAKEGIETKNITVRKSLHSRMKKRLEALNPKQQKKFWLIINNINQELKTINDIEVLDATLFYFFYQQMKQKNFLSEKDLARKREILIRRSELPESSQYKTIFYWGDKKSPANAHETTRIGFSTGEENENLIYGLTFRVALHDHLNSDAGFAPHSELQILNLDFKVRRQNKRSYFFVDRIDFLKISSLIPVDSFEAPLSWVGNVKYYTPPDLSCRECQAWSLSGAAGYSLGNNNLLFSLLPGLDIEINKRLQNKLRGGPQLNSIISASYKEYLQFLAHYTLQLDMAQDKRQSHFHKLKLGLGIPIGRQFDLRTVYEQVFRGEEEGNNSNLSSVGFSYYY